MPIAVVAVSTSRPPHLAVILADWKPASRGVQYLTSLWDCTSRTGGRQSAKAREVTLLEVAVELYNHDTRQASRKRHFSLDWTVDWASTESNPSKSLEVVTMR